MIGAISVSTSCYLFVGMCFILREGKIVNFEFEWRKNPAIFVMFRMCCVCGVVWCDVHTGPRSYPTVHIGNIRKNKEKKYMAFYDQRSGKELVFGSPHFYAKNITKRKINDRTDRTRIADIHHFLCCFQQKSTHSTEWQNLNYVLRSFNHAYHARSTPWFYLNTISVQNPFAALLRAQTIDNWITLL